MGFENELPVIKMYLPTYYSVTNKRFGQFIIF